MVGGKVGAVVGLTLDGGRQMRVVCCYDASLNRIGQPSVDVVYVLVSDDTTSELIREWDDLWWQAGECYWTPSKRRQLQGELPEGVLRQGCYDRGRDFYYDIPIKKISGSF